MTRRFARIAAILLVLAMCAALPGPVWPTAAADPVPETPRQLGGTAAGREHYVPSGATKANRGKGIPNRSHVKGIGELDEYQPHQPDRKPYTTPDSSRPHFDAKTSRRVADQSTATVDTFENADGSITRKAYAGPVNFQRPDGTWVPIDPALRADPDGRLRQKANGLVVDIAGTMSESTLVRLRTEDGLSVSFGLHGANPVPGEVGAATVTYPGVLDDTDVRIESGPAGVEESLVLRSAAAPTSWLYPLALNGLHARLTADGAVELVDAAGTVRVMVPHGSMHDAKPGGVAESMGVRYELVSVDGGPALKVSADETWLRDPARVFPVTVDPTAAIQIASASTYANPGSVTEQSHSTRLYMGYTGRAYLRFDTLSSNYQGYRLSNAALNLFTTYAATCGALPFWVSLVDTPWAANTLLWGNRPTIGQRIGSLNLAMPDACQNITDDIRYGDQVFVNLDANAIKWTAGFPNHGLAIGSDADGDGASGKRFAAANTARQPYLSFDYTPNYPPVVTELSPDDNYDADTPWPTLHADGYDIDRWPNADVKYRWYIYDTNGQLVSSTETDTGSYTPLLKWSRTYIWTVVTNDGYTDSQSPGYRVLRTTIPQPELTQGIGQDPDGRGFDPAGGNFMTTATDATVSTVGPSLSVERSYNSFDTRAARMNTAFGFGWSSLSDSLLTESYPWGQGPGTITVRYPNGQQVVFGRNADGSIVAPSGRYARLSPWGDGYKLTDKAGTTYTFGLNLGSPLERGRNRFKLTAVEDASGRRLTLSYHDPSFPILRTITSASGRSLNFTWGPGSGIGHVASVTTDPVVPGDPNTALTWTYKYQGDKLTDVCPPGRTVATGGCTHYTYTTTTSQYPNTVQDNGPLHYWPLSETSGTVAASTVVANVGADNGTYDTVTLGGPGGLPGSTATSATFNGTTSQVALPTDLYNQPDDRTISLWFKTSTARPGVLLSYNSLPATTGQTSETYIPVVYMGSSGKIYAQPYDLLTPDPVPSNFSLADGNWHNVVLTNTHDRYVLYVDGAPQGSRDHSRIRFTGNRYPSYNYLGGGFLGWQWPDQPNPSVSFTGYRSNFAGSISDVAYFGRVLPDDAVDSLYRTARTATPVLTQINRPQGGVFRSATYDTRTGRVATVTDANHGTWTLTRPVGTGSSQVFAASVLGAGPYDYWRLGDLAGTQARDEVHGGPATYRAVTLGVSGPFADRPAASFNGSSSTVDLSSAGLLAPQISNQPQSIALWFKTSARNQVLFSYQKDAVAPGATTPGDYLPVLYVGNDGKLMGEFWDGMFQPHRSKFTVDDDRWHHVVLAAGRGFQSLYLDGNLMSSASSQILPPPFTGTNTLIGAGFLGGAWPNQNRSTPGSDAGTATYFTGSMSDVAYYRSELTKQQVAGQWRAAQQSEGLTPVALVSVTDPGGNTLTDVRDPRMGNRTLSRADALGNKTSYGYDVGGFLSSITDPNGDQTVLGHDIRGNVVSKTACQSLAAHSCFTSYYQYFPDAISIEPRPDPRNDVLVSTLDSRASGPFDSTYETKFDYDANGNRTTVTPPRTPDISPNFRSMTTAYTTGAAGGPPKGLPTTTTTPGGATQTAVYTNAGDLQQITDAVGLVTAFEYDGLGRVITKRETGDGFEQATRYEYDGVGRVVTLTDHAVSNRVTGAVHAPRTTTGYDLDGNPTSQTVTDLTGGDAPRTVSSEYNTNGQLASFTDAGGGRSTYTYDLYGNKTGEVDPAGTSMGYSYDSNGHLLTTTLRGFTGDPNNPSAPRDLVESSRAYDPAGRLASITDSMGWTTSYTYLDDGKVAQITRSGPGGATFLLQGNTYDGAGHLTSRRVDNGAVTMTYTVDAAGRTVSESDGLSTTAYQYGLDDTVTRMTRGGGGKSTFVDATYDAAGRMLTQSRQSDSAPVTTSWTRDKRGRVKTMTDPLGQPSQYGYDESGRLAVIVEPMVAVESTIVGSTDLSPITMIGYDTFGQQTEHSDPNGGVTVTGYDATGRATSVRLPNTAAGTSTATRTYTRLGQVATETDPLGKTTSYTYTQLGDLAKIVGRDGGVSTFTYDTNGERLSATDPTGAVTQATYDYLGHQLTSTEIVRQPSTQAFTTTNAYNDKGQLTDVTTPRGVRTSYTYDQAGRPASTVDPAGAVSTYGYDHLDRQISAAYSDGLRRDVTFDQLGRPVSVKDSKSSTVLRTTGATYDNGDNLRTQTDAVGATTSYTYDARHKVRSITQPVTGSTSITSTFAYDAVGNRTRYTDGRDNSFATTYNSWNLPITQWEPPAGPYQSWADRQVNLTYDLAGRVTSRTAPGGVLTNYSYDDAGKLTRQTGSGAAAPTADRVFGYDLAGRVTSASAPGGTNTFGYDDRGLLLSTSGPSGSSAFGYDGDGRMTARTDAAGTATYAYDTAGRISGATDPLTGAQVSYEYTPTSLPSKITYGAGGNVRTFGYDDLRRLTADTVTTAGGAPVASISYGYNGNGDLTAKTTTGLAGASGNTYTYDLARRLTSWTSGSTSTAYAYDAAGNRTQAGSKTFTYNARNQLETDGTSQYSYTARGTLSSVVTGGNTTQVRSDAFDQEIDRGAAGYGYDAFGRVVTAPGRTLSYSGSGNAVAGDGTALYSRDPDGDLLGMRQGGRSDLAWTDQHGDVVGGLSGTGLAGSTSYDPWGTRTASSNAIGNLGYQSGWTDPGTGQVNMLSRWYSPDLGRFTTRDAADNAVVPVPIAGHRYAYVGDNPLLGTDPDGRCGGFFNVFCAIGNAVGNGARAVGNFVGNGAQAVGNFLGNVARTVSNAISDAVRWAGQQISRGASAVAGVVRGGVRAVTRAVGQVYDKGAELVADAVYYVNRSVETIADEIRDLYNAGKAEVVAAYHALREASARVVAPVARFVAETGGAVVNAVSTAYNGAADAVSAGSNWAQHHAADIAGFVVSTAVFLGCEAVLGIPTMGVGAVAGAAACGAVAGAVGGAVTYGVKAAQSGDFSWSDLGNATLMGAAAGAVAGPLGYGAGKVASWGLGKAAPVLAPILGRGSGETAAATTAGQAAKSSGTRAVGSEARSTASEARPAPTRTANCHSFEPATRVLLASGTTKAISDVKVGDTVLAADAGTGSTKAEPVIALHTNTDTDLADVTTRDASGHTATLHTTQHHPFWDATDHTWVNAGNLQPGHRLATADGTTVTVTAVATHTAPATMYDLTVAERHTYHVLAGTTPVLVHNCGEDDLVEAVGSRYADLTTKGGAGYQSVNQRGPVLSGVKDRLTGEIRLSQNHPEAPVNLHPSLAERFESLGAGAPGKGVPGSHGEVWGLNSLLWAREAAGLGTAIDDSFVYYSVRLRGAAQGNPIPRCANCAWLTGGAGER